MARFSIPRLRAGGLITNYFCSSKCRHCLYNCSPARPKHYLTPDRAGRLFEIAGAHGATALHIGGGEPFLAPETLGEILKTANLCGIGIDYVETNASWFKDTADACRILEMLRTCGLKTLLVSISPFHMEYIPLEKTKGVMAACEKTGIRVFPWVASFMPDLTSFDETKKHRFEKVLGKYGNAYLSRIRSRYWIHMGGRALTTFRPVFPLKSLERVLRENPDNCAGQLSDTGHFHIDLYGSYIPGLCSGLTISARDMAVPLSKNEYPVITVLARQGVSGLLAWAKENAGFSDTGKRYINRCDVCNDIRRFLFKKGMARKELNPPGYYEDWKT